MADNAEWLTTLNSRPDGSPTRVVPPPISATGLPPVACSQCSIMIEFGTAPNAAVMADNAEWLTTLNYIEMLRDIGRHFSVVRILRVSSRPDGSPTRVVPPPISATGLPPVACSPTPP
jgi:hypothetical protein